MSIETPVSRRFARLSVSEPSLQVVTGRNGGQSKACGHLAQLSLYPRHGSSFRGRHVSYHHSIAIDSTRLALVSTSDHRHTPEAIDTVRFLQAVTASLELDEVFGAFNACLHEVFEHDGWEYQAPDDEFHLTGGRTAPHRIEYRLTLNGQALGVIRLMRGRRFSEDEQRYVEGLLALAAPAIQNALRFSRLVRQLDSDPLTGLGNRRALWIQGERWLAESLRHRHPLSLLVLDLDFFKAINDTHGHPVGDQVLCRVAQTLKATTRASDLCVRLGGDEFVVLLPETDLKAAKECAERIRRALSQQFVETPSGERIGIRTSVGAATLRPGMTLDALYQEADTALYAAKHSRDLPPASVARAGRRIGRSYTLGGLTACEA